MRLKVTILLLVTAFVSVACSEKKTWELPLGEIAEGDLAFRCGRGLFSRIVTTAEEEGVYSHIGLVVKDEGRWKVAHAVPGEREFKGDFDRVKLEDIETFFAPGRAFRGCLVRTGINIPDRLPAKAITAARDSVEFDGDYDLLDSTKVYCTEFVWRLFMDEGVELSEGRRTSVNVIGISGDIILPEHILHYSKNKLYYQF